MKCVLMNKTIEVLVAEYDAELFLFSKIYQLTNIDYAPLHIKSAYQKAKNISTELSQWFNDRGIPFIRDDLDLLLTKLNVTTAKELLDKAFGLSLSDQYWIKPYESTVQYKDINFFERKFNSADFTNATFSNSNDYSTKISLISPNNTTDGRLKKTWIIKQNKRYLLKGGFKNEVMQPFNEVLATMICEKLSFYHTKYILDIVSNKIVSKCECFVNKDTELVTAYQILHNNCDKKNAYEEYIKILENHSIKNVRKKLEDMFILDYIIMNEDRHLNNFGIIRDVNTLEWLDVAPIFDNGQSLNILDYNDEEVIINGQGRFFYNIDSFDRIIENIQDIKRYDLSKLDGIVDEFDNLLHKYTNITHMTDRRINKICTLLYSRINTLKKIIDKINK
ncbi:MAG: HipA domain-containing protein [Bacilli bacterium]